MAFLTEAANRGSISTGYEIDNSLKFESANTESLTKKILIEEHKLYPKALNVVVKKLLLNKKIND